MTEGCSICIVYATFRTKLCHNEHRYRNLDYRGPSGDFANQKEGYCWFVANEGLPPKRKKKSPQNKPSRNEPSLPGCNTSSMVGSVDPRNMAALTHFIKSAMRTLWPLLCCACFFLFFLLKPRQLTKQPWAADPAIDEILHRGRLDSSRLGLFWGIFFFFLAEVPHYVLRN